ncbi:hypothetical protein [Longivirga aurantiaca]|uniref:DUF2029 domain-containing protein n=1 Tax=Longivirga aurantiaca TaxID=1837743 RepID=A0ABW1T3B2_9ACTN
MSATRSDSLGRAAAALERGTTFVLRGRTDPEAPWRGIRLLIVWLLTRLVVVTFVPLAPYVVNDVNYYATVITGQADPGFPGSLREYPVPAIWWLTIPSILAGGEIKPYGWWFVFLMLCIDGGLLVVLRRIGRSPRAITAWLAAGLAIGPILLLRFDLLTGAMVATALLVAVPRPRLAAALMVVAASVKLWPGVFVGLVAAAGPRRRPALVAAGITSVVLVVAATATSGWDRLLTPLAYQTDRGLQIESLFALPAMMLWSLGVEGYVVDYPASLSFEVSGPGTTLLGMLATLATVAALAWVLGTTAAVWRRASRPDLLTVAAWALLSGVCLLVLSNKVFSPQYMAWMLPIAVALLAVTGEARARTSTYLMMCAAVAAQLLYPWLYDAVTSPYATALSPVAVVLIAVRLALVCVVAAIATQRTWQLLRADEPLAAAR